MSSMQQTQLSGFARKLARFVEVVDSSSVVECDSCGDLAELCCGSSLPYWWIFSFEA